MNRFAVCTTLFTLMHSYCARAQEAPPQRVEVSGSADTRRDDTAARIVVGRDQIARFGDTQLSAILKRQGGVAVTGNEVRLRGLGAGYTQILINGDAAPPGFALDSIAPAMVERIEILRSGSAELGSQAIAGTINLILKKAGGRAQRELKLGLGAPGRPDPALAASWSGERDALAYSMGAELARLGTDNRYHSMESGSPGAWRRATREDTAMRTTRLQLAPRLNWKGAGGTLAWQAMAETARAANQGGVLETVVAGGPSAYPVSGFVAGVDSWSARNDLSWTQGAGAGKLVAKAAASRYVRQSDYVFRGAGERDTLVRRVVSSVTDDAVSLGGKYLAPLTAQHSVGLGWESGINRRSETRGQDDSTFAALPLSTMTEDYRADVGRLALFAQDEWSVTPRLQAYLGVRWEGLRGSTRGRTLEEVRTRSGVASPSAQLLWKLPDAGKDQLRLALGRSYKAPPVRNLVPRRYTVNNGNSPTNPDLRGNPALRPELAWGLDLAYERYAGNDAMSSVSVYARRIGDVTVQTLYLEDGAWLSTPFNHGRARVAGIEFDGRFTIGKVAWRANGARHWSRLEAVPGPDNRLAEQARATANLGADLRWSDSVSMGANLNLQFGGAARLSERLRSHTGPVRALDLYGVWKLDGRTRLRVNAANVLHPAQRTSRFYDDGESSNGRTTDASTRALVRVTLERSL